MDLVTIYVEPMGCHGDQVNAVLSAIGHNLRLILDWLGLRLCLALFAILDHCPAPSVLMPAS